MKYSRIIVFVFWSVMILVLLYLSIDYKAVRFMALILIGFRVVSLIYINILRLMINRLELDKQKNLIRIKKFNKRINFLNGYK